MNSSSYTLDDNPSTFSRQNILNRMADGSTEMKRLAAKIVAIIESMEEIDALLRMNIAVPGNDSQSPLINEVRTLVSILDDEESY